MNRRRFLTGAAALLCAASTAVAAPSAQAQTLAEVLALAQTPVGGQTPAGGLFGSVEFTNASLRGLPQWQKILSHMASDGPAFAECTGDSEHCGTPALRSWRQLQIAAAPLARMDKLHAVNRFFNRWPYKSDRETYRAAEYWATPSEFMTYSGDCEDFAIAKFFALRELGFANHELRIAVVFDSLRQIGHAVLAVYTEDDILILNNQTDTIASHSRYGHFVPKYLVNETTLWTAALPTLGAIVSGTTAAAGPSGRRPSGATPRPSGGSAAPVRLRAPDTKGPA